MKAINKFSSREHVRILQGLLNVYGGYKLECDGLFGNKTKTALDEWQKSHGLVQDGSCGDLTLATFNVLETDNNTLLMRIPLAKITKCGIVTKDKKNISQKSWGTNYARTYNFIINGGMFDTKSKAVVQDTIQSGQIINGGNYSNYGMAFCNDRNTGSIYPSTTANSSHKPVDFIGGAPALLPYKDTKGLSHNYLNQSTRWNMIGCDDKYFYYFTSISSVKMSQMEKWANYYNIQTLINLDGGGSRFLTIGGSEILKTDGRGIPQIIGINIKEV